MNVVIYIRTKYLFIMRLKWYVIVIYGKLCYGKVYKVKIYALNRQQNKIKVKELTIIGVIIKIEKIMDVIIF